jgi:hypothetical protein
MSRTHVLDMFITASGMVSRSAGSKSWSEKM